jgi:hypothetical protein
MEEKMCSTCKWYTSDGACILSGLVIDEVCKWWNKDPREED